MPIIACDNVSFAYANGRGKLENLTITCEQGSYTLLVGPSGAGKSTVFRLLVRLEEANGGAIYFQGKPLSDYSPMQLRSRVMLLPQTPTLFPGSVRETLLLPWSFAEHKLAAKPDDAVLSGWLARLRMADIPLEENATALSLGQQQRICLIRCLLLEPAVLLLDEPTSALDAESRAIVLDIAAEMHFTRSTTVVQIDHSGYEPQFPYVRYIIDNGTAGRSHG